MHRFHLRRQHLEQAQLALDLCEAVIAALCARGIGKDHVLRARNADRIVLRQKLMEQCGSTAGKSRDEDGALDPLQENSAVALLFGIKAQEIGETAKSVPARAITACYVEIGFAVVAFEQDLHRLDERAVGECVPPGATQRGRAQLFRIERQIRYPGRDGELVQSLNKTIQHLLDRSGPLPMHSDRSGCRRKYAQGPTVLWKKARFRQATIGQESAKVMPCVNITT